VGCKEGVVICWIDLETTGLDPCTGSILEIAMIATDDNFEQIREPFVSIVRPLHMRGWEVMDDFVKEMHTKSGLAYEIWCDPDRRTVWDNVPRLGDVERKAINWLQHIGSLAGFDDKKAFRAAPLGGNTVHFDKRWLIEHMDELEALFSHRIYDVSSFTEEVKRAAPEVYKRRPGLGPDGKPVPMHRALDDIRNSIETAKFYRGCARWSAVP
jgi:oligoribonuclease